MTNEIKVSDILLDIQKRIINLEGVLKLHDYQLKLIVSNFNKFFESQKNQPVKSEENGREESLQEKKQRLMTIKKTNDQLMETVQNVKKIELPKSLNPLEQEEEQIEFKIQSIGNFGGNDKKAPVSQKVVDKNGKPISGALVMIKDTNNRALTIKTNTNGKWQALLPLGKYNTTVGVTPSANGGGVQYEQSFEVNTVDRPLEIPTPKL